MLTWSGVVKKTKCVLALWRSIVIFVSPLVLLPLALQESKEARCAYGVGILALYWMTEALPLPVTSLLPVVLFPALGVVGTDKICVTYFKEPNMMFIGGLIVAIAVEHCNLHKRVALRILLTIGVSPQRLLIGFMFTTAFLSMFISNTACTAMMIPIVFAVLDELKEHDQVRQQSFCLTAGETKSRHDSGTFDEETRRKSVHRIELGKAERPSPMETSYFLGVAYAANIGGTGTLTGTGTNLTFRGLFEQTFHQDGLNFASWMKFNVPLMIINVILAWIWLHVLFMKFPSPRKCWNNLTRTQSRTPTPDELAPSKYKAIAQVMQENYDKLGPLTFHEFAVACVFISTVLLWFFRKPEFMPGWGDVYTDVVIDDATAAMGAVVLLFILPANLNFLKPGIKNRKATPSLLNWKIVHEKVPWGLVLLSGGGFAMAEATKESGLSNYLGHQLTVIGNLDRFVMLIVICVATTFVTEVSSNTAIANIVLPVLAEMSMALRINPLYLMLPATLCCSYAFMLPVATPPNAIVFAASNMKAKDMIKAGLGMNIICLVALIVCLKTFGISMYDLNTFPPYGDVYIAAHKNRTY